MVLYLKFRLYLRSKRNSIETWKDNEKKLSRTSLKDVVSLSIPSHHTTRPRDQVVDPWEVTYLSKYRFRTEVRNNQHTGSRSTNWGDSKSKEWTFYLYYHG